MDEGSGGDEAEGEAVSRTDRDRTEDSEVDLRRRELGAQGRGGGRGREDGLGGGGIGVGRGEGAEGSIDAGFGDDGCRSSGGDVQRGGGERGGDSSAEGLDSVALAKGSSGEDVAEISRLLVLDQRNVRAPSRVVFNPNDLLLSRLLALKVDETNTTLVSSSARANGDLARVVTSSC